MYIPSLTLWYYYGTNKELKKFNFKIPWNMWFVFSRLPTFLQKKYICDVKLWLTLIPIGYGHFIRCSFLTQSRKLNFVMRWINLIRHYAWSIHLTNPQFIYILKTNFIQDATILRIKHRTMFCISIILDLSITLYITI